MQPKRCVCGSKLSWSRPSWFDLHRPRYLANVQQARLRIALTAELRPCAFQMEVIRMGSVVGWAKHRAKAFAGAAVYNAQEFSDRRRPAMPVLLEIDPAPVFKQETRHINGFGAGVGGKAFRSCNPAAIVTAHRFDPCQSAAQNLACGAIDPKPGPIAKRFGGGALHWPYIAHTELRTIPGQRRKLHGSQFVASRRGIGVGDRREPRSCRAELSHTDAIIGPRRVGWRRGCDALGWRAGWRCGAHGLGRWALLGRHDAASGKRRSEHGDSHKR
jgi:hypothetical protein